MTTRLPTVLRQRVRRYVPELCALVLCAVALAGGVRLTGDLEWPAEVDHYRDMGAAQSLLDGNRGDDPAYRGERWWYNPLGPWVWAGVSATTDTPLPVVEARSGAYLNLLGALAFYLLAAVLFGRPIAVACLAVFLFVGATGVPPWSQASYTPWLWPVCFVQAFFYLAAAAWITALRSDRRRWDVVAGLLLGIAFLGHAAPAAILGLAVSGVALYGAVRSTGRHRWRHLERLAVIGGVSLAVASPFLVPLVAHYRMHALNTVPMRFAGLQAPAAIGALLGIRPFLALLGLWALWRRSVPDVEQVLGGRGRAALAALAAVTVTLMIYGFGADSLGFRGILLPMLVPTFHYHFYFTALQSLLAGVGLAAVAERTEQIVRARRWHAAAPAAIAVAISLAWYPVFYRSRDQRRWIASARRLSVDAARLELYRWARTSAGPDDVLLTDDRYAIMAVVPAGRHVVCLSPTMSNPYVDRVVRDTDRREMFRALRHGDTATFRALARRWGVTHVVSAPATESDCCRLDDRPDGTAPPGLTLVHRAGALSIYRLLDAQGTQSP